MLFEEAKHMKRYLDKHFSWEGALDEVHANILEWWKNTQGFSITPLSDFVGSHGTAGVVGNTTETWSVEKER
jgi:hypothetical protein